MSQDHSMKRRDFLATTGAAAAVCATGVADDALANALSNAHPLHKLKQEDFAELIGQSFHIEGSRQLPSDHRTTLVLKSADQHPAQDRPAGLRQEPFSLLFVAKSDDGLSDGTHLVSGAGTQRCEVYLQQTRCESDPQHKYFEAVFN